MRSINDLRFAHKFLILGILAAAMMVVPSALLMRGDLQSIHRAQEEVQGLAPSGSLLKLVQLTQQHRGLSALYLGGKEKSPEPRQAKQREINEIGRAHV